MSNDTGLSPGCDFAERVRAAKFLMQCPLCQASVSYFTLVHRRGRPLAQCPECGNAHERPDQEPAPKRF